MATIFRPASTKQTEFAHRLYCEFYGTALGEERMVEDLGSAPSTVQVSKVIDWLLLQIKNRKAQATKTVPVGIHVAGDALYRVRENQAGTSRYAERLTTAHEREIDPTLTRWQYVGRAPLAQLSEATVLTLEQATTFGHAYGVCAVCGALLDDPASVAAGIGPVCAKKF